MSDVSISVQKRGARMVSQIVRDGLINDKEFRFNHLESRDVHWEVEGDNGIYECNGFFPTRNGYEWDDPRQKRNGGPGHPDDKKSFFFWRDYDSYHTDDPNFRTPDWMSSHHRLFVFDGTTNYWDGSVPKYGNKLSDWEDHYFVVDRLVPISVMGPDDETPTDRDRRYTYYRQNECIWGLLNCKCSYNGGPCQKVETEYYRNGGSCGCGFGFNSPTDCYEDSSCDVEETDSSSYRIWSLGTNQDNTLGSRMLRLGDDVSGVDY